MDIGEQAVRQAQSDTVYVNHQERLNSRDCLSGDIADFLDPIEQQEDASRPILQSNKPAQPHRLKPWFRDILRSGLLQVKRGDVRTDLAPPSDQPAIVLFRNAWHYLKDKERTDLIGKLFQTLKSGSVIGVGHLEQQRSGEYATKTRQSTVELLERGGFKPMTKKNPVFFVKP
jgi:hypothetical protein